MTHVKSSLNGLFYAWGVAGELPVLSQSQITLDFSGEGKQQLIKPSFKTKTEADNALARLRTQHEMGEMVATDKITVKKLLEDWFAHSRFLPSGTESLGRGQPLPPPDHLRHQPATGLRRGALPGGHRAEDRSALLSRQSLS